MKISHPPAHRHQKLARTSRYAKPRHACADQSCAIAVRFPQTLTTQRTNAQGNPVTSTVNSQVTFGLDQNGNLTSDGLRAFEYDAANRLSKVKVSQTSTANAEASKITYLHNALGQRVFKSEPQVAQTAPSQTELGIDFITWLKSNFGWLFAQAQANATLGQSYVYDDANLGAPRRTNIA